MGGGASGGGVGSGSWCIGMAELRDQDGVPNESSTWNTFTCRASFTIDHFHMLLLRSYLLVSFLASSFCLYTHDFFCVFFSRFSSYIFPVLHLNLLLFYPFFISKSIPYSLSLYFLSTSLLLFTLFSTQFFLGG